MKRTVKKVFLWTDILFLFALFGASGIFFRLGNCWNGIGACIVLCNISAIPIYKHGYKILGYNEIFKLKDICVPNNHKEELLAYLDGRSNSLDIEPTTWSGDCSVEVYYNTKAQLFIARYHDDKEALKSYEYPLMEITKEKAEALERLIIT